MSQSTCLLLPLVRGSRIVVVVSSFRAVPPIGGEDFGLMSGTEMGKALLEFDRIPLHWYDAPPISFEEEMFLIPEDQLIVPLGRLSTHLSVHSTVSTDILYSSGLNDVG